MNERSHGLVVVVGMHRSGSSALTRGMGALGLDLGDNLMEPAPDNETGFWEDLDLFGINVELMERMGVSWDTLRPMPIDTLPGETLSRLTARAAQLLRAKLERGRGSFAMKDPRTARLLPFWHGVFEHLGVQPKWMLTCRNPVSVMRSLQRRNGFGEGKGYLLWLVHVLDALQGTRTGLRVVVDYDQMMDDPLRQLHRAAEGLRLPSPREADLSAYAGTFLQPRLRHTRFSADDLTQAVSVPPHVGPVFASLSALARDEVLPPGHLEQVLAAARNWHDENVSLLRAIDDAEQAISRQAQALERVVAENVAAHRRAEKLQGALNERNEQIAGLDARLGEAGLGLGGGDDVSCKRQDVTSPQ